ncbi:MAG TPA: hypothetical protein PKK48_01710 [Phycisphaerae bacterium]|nr:hypothetical protein [Phycisphaerae bacterium]HPS52688.1 hypothetical protein [Phycisphaerae bacterium]
MDEFSKIDKLVELAEELGMEVRRAPSLFGDEHPGGSLVRLKGREILFLDPDASVEDQINVAVHALAGRESLRDRFLEPEIRQLLEEAGDE